jgi:hypothetical protein
MLYSLQEAAMTERAVLIREIETLPPSCWGEVLDFVEYIKQKNQKRTSEMERAAEMMAAEYAAAPELTAFCALDGEDFYEAR